MLGVMQRSVVALVLAFSLGVLPVVHDVCGPECEMGETPVLVAFDAAAGDLEPQNPDAECPLHPAEEQAPLPESDGCTHEHGTVREAPERASAVAPSGLQAMDLPDAAFSWAGPRFTPGRRNHVVASPPGTRPPTRLALRI